MRGRSHTSTVAAGAGRGVDRHPGQLRRRQVPGRTVDPVPGPPGGSHRDLTGTHGGGDRSGCHPVAAAPRRHHQHPFEPAGTGPRPGPLEAVGAQTDPLHCGRPPAQGAARRRPGWLPPRWLHRPAGPRRHRPDAGHRRRARPGADAEGYHGGTVVGQDGLGLAGLAFETALGQEVPIESGTGAGGKRQVREDRDAENGRVRGRPPHHLEAGRAHWAARPRQQRLAVLLPAGHRPHQIGEPVEIRPDERLRGGGTEHVALGSAHDGTGHVEPGRYRVVARNDEVGEGREAPGQVVDPILQGRHHGFGHERGTRPKLVPVVGRGRQLGHDDVEVPLEPRPGGRPFPSPARLRPGPRREPPGPRRRLRWRK